MIHTILGAGGPVANALTRELTNNNNTIRLVSRRPIQPGKNATWQKADLTNLVELRIAAEGSGVIYLCAGLVYDAEIWKEQWPLIMQNVITVAKENKARLIFFDNVYMYGLVDGPMKEDTPYKPVSIKGGVRAKIADMLMDEVKAGNLNASIARGADFYATDSGNSFFDMMLLSKFARNERAQWLGNPTKKHNFTFIPDAGRAMFLLGQNPDSDNQVWHVPTAAPLTGKEFIALAAGIYQVKPRFMAVSKFMLKLMGIFVKVIRGTVEMFYQYDRDYDFKSSKFEKAFNFKPTSYAEGIKQAKATLYPSV